MGANRVQRHREVASSENRSSMFWTGGVHAKIGYRYKTNSNQEQQECESHITSRGSGGTAVTINENAALIPPNRLKPTSKTKSLALHPTNAELDTLLGLLMLWVP